MHLIKKGDKKWCPLIFKKSWVKYKGSNEIVVPESSPLCYIVYCFSRFIKVYIVQGSLLLCLKIEACTNVFNDKEKIMMGLVCTPSTAIRLQTQWVWSNQIPNNLSITNLVPVWQLLVLKYVQNKDVFMRYHKAHLTRRLILDTSADNEKEENMVEWLRVGLVSSVEDFVHILHA